LQGKLHDMEMSLRGILRGFGLKVGATTPKTYPARIRTLVDGHPALEVIATALLKAREVLADELRGFERRVRTMARQDERAHRLMTTPGVGTLVALTFVAAVDDPERFRSSRAVGPHFGLTPKKYQSGETDDTGRISKIGDAGVRTALYEAANVILMRPVRGSDLKTWASSVAKRAGLRKAKPALLYGEARHRNGKGHQEVLRRSHQRRHGIPDAAGAADVRSRRGRSMHGRNGDEHPQHDPLQAEIRRALELRALHGLVGDGPARLARR
jgi:transposase